MIVISDGNAGCNSRSAHSRPENGVNMRNKGGDSSEGEHTQRQNGAV